MNPDPFSYNLHRGRRIGYDKAVELAKGLRGEVSYRKAKAILKTHDLKIDHKEFYNLTWRREERQKAIPPQLPLGVWIGRKMIGTEATMVAEADKFRANRKVAKSPKPGKDMNPNWLH